MRISRRSIELRRRYTKRDLSVLTKEEASRFIANDDRGPQEDMGLAWELLYRLEPSLYDRLAQAERIHPAILEWLPRHVARIVEVAPGTGRLTVVLLERCDELIAVEPAATFRSILGATLGRRSGVRLRLVHGFFDSLPVPDRSAQLVVSCSALTPDSAHGGEGGLLEMERVCTVGGRVIVVWPNHLGWLAEHGYRYISFQGETRVEFASLDEALEMAETFYPHAVPEIRRRGEPCVPYEVLGINAPRDVAYKEIVA